MKRILIVESDNELSERLYRAFSSIETEVVSCSTMESATALLEEQIYNIAVIDVDLSDGNGYDLIYEIELGIYDSKDVQVVAILPNDRKPDYTEILQRGITDYITKPFSVAVLKSKIFTIAAMQKKRQLVFGTSNPDKDRDKDKIVDINGKQKTVIGNYVFDFERGEFSIGGRKILLDEVQQILLRTLVENKGMVLRKNALVDSLRNQSRLEFIDESVLADIMDELTERLSAYNYIKTVFGIGYLWAKLEDSSVLM
jgi:DNA-binding response OmpR family regulator